jgi:predicted ester cyclase
MNQSVPMNAKEKELAEKTRRGWDYFNARDIEAFVKGMAPDYVWYTDVFPEPLRGPDGTRRGLQGFFKAFPDIRFEVEQIFAHENYTVVRFSGQGTRTDGFMGLPPTNRPYVYHGSAINRFNERGQRVVTWVFFDRYKILQQVADFPATLGSFVPGGTGRPQAPHAEQDSGAAARNNDFAAQGEELILRYGVGQGSVLDDPQYITLHIDMFTPDGGRGGYYMGIQQATGPMNPQQLMATPPMPPQPIDQPGGIPIVPVGGNYKSTWWFNDRDSITAVGPSVAHLVPLEDGSFIFSTSASGIITGGTGQYEGAAGVKSAIGSGHLPQGAQLRPGARFHVKSTDIFRVVKRESQAQRPAASARTRGTTEQSSRGPAGGGQTSWSPPAALRATSMPAGTSLGMPPGMPPLPPTFPPGVNPETYKIKEVNQLLKSAAYFPIFNVANPNRPNQVVSLLPTVPLLDRLLMVAVDVNEQLHRFEVNVEAAPGGPGLWAHDVVGEPVAGVHIRWTPIPENFEAAPDICPPPTILNPFSSQRFTMLNGRLSFMDADGSGFHGFGTGRTFPVSGNLGQLRVGAVIDILKGFGKFEGLPGTAVINGYIQPPDSLALNLMVRVMDPTGKLKADSPVTPIRAIADPDPGATFMVFLGETDPDQPVQLNIAPDGTILGSNVHELLRLVHIGFDLGTPAGLRSRTVEGPIVGSVSATLFFNPMSPQSVSPIQTTDGIFTFFDQQRRVFGTLASNMVEGRAMRTELAGAPMPVFRFGGFGPILGGTGEFGGADGMMTMNSAVSVFPRTLSNLYTFRLVDPDGRFRAALRGAYS